MILREATFADVDFIMRTERLPGYERSVGQWSAAEHTDEMSKPASRYLIAEENGAPVAFAILQTLDDPGGNIYLKRFAVARQGEGIGTRAMRLLQDWVFAIPAAHRFHLHFSALNEPARRLYAAAGFQPEGIEREVFMLEDGARVDSVRLSILRQEWEKFRGV
ncbi:MAG: GNAT family N-acetyltransferase [Hyphomonadaceae bacterium]|nr:GNAT family N-acetyltransferase [Hyphomonadaceae bacterium]